MVDTLRKIHLMIRFTHSEKYLAACEGSDAFLHRPLLSSTGRCRTRRTSSSPTEAPPCDGQPFACLQSDQRQKSTTPVRHAFNARGKLSAMFAGNLYRATPCSARVAFSLLPCCFHRKENITYRMYVWSTASPPAKCAYT